MDRMGSESWGDDNSLVLQPTMPPKKTKECKQRSEQGRKTDTLSPPLQELATLKEKDCTSDEIHRGSPKIQRGGETMDSDDEGPSELGREVLTKGSPIQGLVKLTRESITPSPTLLGQRSSESLNAEADTVDTADKTNEDNQFPAFRHSPNESDDSQTTTLANRQSSRSSNFSESNCDSYGKTIEHSKELPDDAIKNFTVTSDSMNVALSRERPRKTELKPAFNESDIARQNMKNSESNNRIGNKEPSKDVDSRSQEITDHSGDGMEDYVERSDNKSEFLSRQSHLKSFYDHDKREATSWPRSSDIDPSSHKSPCSEDESETVRNIQQQQPLLKTCSRSIINRESRNVQSDNRRNSCFENMTSSSKSSDVNDKCKQETSTSSSGGSRRIKMESPIADEKSTATESSGFGESHVNKLMSFVDSLDRRPTHSHNRLGSSNLLGSSLSAKPPSSALGERSTTSRTSELLYRPYKSSPALQKTLQNRTSGRAGDDKMDGNPDQPLDLSVNKGRQPADSRSSASSSQIITDYNGFSSPFGLSSLESMRAMFGEGSPMIPSVSSKSTDTLSKQNSSWMGLANYPANMNWQFASSLAALQAQMEAMLMTYPLFKASMDLYKTMMPPFVPSLSSASDKTSTAQSTSSSTGVNSTAGSLGSHSKDKQKRLGEHDKRPLEPRTPNGHHPRRSPAVCSSGGHSTRRGGDVSGYMSDVKRLRTENASWLPSLTKHSSERLSLGERKSYYSQAYKKSLVGEEGRASSKVQSSSDERNFRDGGEPATSSSEDLHSDAEDRTMLTSFACGCGRRFQSLYQLTVHIEESGHSPSQVRVDSVDDFPKLVRGQDLWLSGGQDQRDQTLRCIRCKESFQSLPELTVHMIKSRHYVDIVGQAGDLERPLLSDGGDVFMKMQRNHSQQRARTSSGGSSGRDSDEPGKWPQHSPPTQPMISNYSNFSQNLVSSKKHGVRELSTNAFSGGSKKRHIQNDIPRAASSGSVENKDKYVTSLHSPLSNTRPSSAHVLSRSSPLHNGVVESLNLHNRWSSGPLTKSPKREQSLSPGLQNVSKSHSTEETCPDEKTEENQDSTPYTYSDFKSYKLRRPHNRSLSPIRNKQIKMENSEEEKGVNFRDEHHNDKNLPALSGVDSDPGNGPRRDPDSPLEGTSKGYMSLICPSTEGNDSSSTLKAMESFVERSFSSGKFSSPLSASQNPKLGSTSGFSPTRGFKSRSPGLERNHLLKPYITPQSHTLKLPSTGARDYTRNYDKPDVKWTIKPSYIDKKTSVDYRPTNLSADGLLMIKGKKNSCVENETDRSRFDSSSWNKNCSPNVKFSTNNNIKKDASYTSVASENSKSDKISGPTGDKEVSPKKRQFTSSTLEYLQHFVDDAALKPAPSSRDGKKSLISAEGKLSIKI